MCRSAEHFCTSIHEPPWILPMQSCGERFSHRRSTMYVYNWVVSKIQLRVQEELYLANVRLRFMIWFGLWSYRKIHRFINERACWHCLPKANTFPAASLCHGATMKQWASFFFSFDAFTAPENPPSWEAIQSPWPWSRFHALHDMKIKLKVIRVSLRCVRGTFF